MRAKTYSYLTDKNDGNEKVKDTKKHVIKRKIKFKDYKNCLKTTHLENKINQLEKNKVNIIILRESHNEFIKDNKLILKKQQRSESERHNDFTEEIDKIALSSNDDRKIQSVHSVKTYAYGARKYLISLKEKNEM